MWKSATTLTIVCLSFAHLASCMSATAEIIGGAANTPVHVIGNSVTDASNLADVLLKVEKEKNDLLRSKLALADAFVGDAELRPSEKYLDLLNDLHICSKNGLFLVSRVIKFCIYFEKKIDKLPISYEEKLKMRIRLDEVRKSAEEFGILLQKPGDVVIKDNCDVLDVNNNLKVVVLGTGFLDGSSIGMQWIVQEAGKALVNIVAVRPYASAAIVTCGDIQRISPGMKAKIVK